MHLLPPIPDDQPFLWEMLAQAALPGGGELPPGLLADDHIRRYLDGWGGPDDLGLVAWEDGRRLGAAWTRLLPVDRPGYGYVDAETPELCIAVADAARGRGIGRALVVATLDLAAAAGRPQVSLSVAGTNVVAAALYRSLGFVDVGLDEGGSTTMVAPTAPAPPPPPAEAPGGGAPLAARPATPADGPAMARLRQVLLESDDPGWVAPSVRLWPEEVSAGRWRAFLVDGPDGRPVASALAAVATHPPAPGRWTGRTAHVSSVATEPTWRRRGLARAVVTALLAHLDAAGIETSTLSAAPDGAALYRSLGYQPDPNPTMRRPRPALDGG